MLRTLAQHAPCSLTDVGDELPSLAEVWSTLTLQAGFNTTTVILGTTLLGIASGLIGTFALLRKRSMMSDALSHATLPGIAAAFLIAAAFGLDGRSLPLLLAGGTVTGVVGVVAIQALLRHTRLREDASIGIVLSVFFGVGIVLLSVIQALPTGNQGGLATFIYGQTAAMRASDAVLMGAIALAATLAAALLHKEFALVCFNDAFARVAGWPAARIDLLMMALVVAAVMAGLQAVGLILVVAMLIVPAAAARFWTDRLRTLLILAALVGGLSGYLGASISALLPRKPAGSVIVLTAGAVFVVSMLIAPRRGVLASAVRRLALSARMAGDHVVEALHEMERDAGEPVVARPGAELAAIARLRSWTPLTARLVCAAQALRGRLERAGGGYALTDLGRRDGARVARNHALWEQYLVSYADVAPSHVDWSVDQVEHVLSDDLVRELEAALRRRGVRAEGAAP